jgi:hypothetical protein
VTNIGVLIASLWEFYSYLGDDMLIKLAIWEHLEDEYGLDVYDPG